MPDCWNSSSNNNIPFVLIYEKTKKKIYENIDEKIVEVIQDKPNSFFDITIDERHNENKSGDILISENNTQPSNEELNSNANDKIELNFKTTEGKEMRIDTNASKTFNEIVNELRDRFDVIFDE